jgi:hypothetical protein
MLVLVVFPILKYGLKSPEVVSEWTLRRGTRVVKTWREMQRFDLKIE